jgi:hypothetical protein
MVFAEDIEPGDTLNVESDGGACEQMVFVEKNDKNSVVLKDKTGEEFTFSAQTLEEHGGYRFIAGKSEEELRTCS